MRKGMDIMNSIETINELSEKIINEVLNMTSTDLQLSEILKFIKIVNQKEGDRLEVIWRQYNIETKQSIIEDIRKNRIQFDIDYEIEESYINIMVNKIYATFPYLKEKSKLTLELPSKDFEIISYQMKESICLSNEPRWRMKFKTAKSVTKEEGFTEYATIKLVVPSDDKIGKFNFCTVFSAKIGLDLPNAYCDKDFYIRRLYVKFEELVSDILSAGNDRNIISGGLFALFDDILANKKNKVKIMG